VQFRFSSIKYGTVDGDERDLIKMSPREKA